MIRFLRWSALVFAQMSDSDQVLVDLRESMK
jgi:hypothetical protein